MHDDIGINQLTFAFAQCFYFPTGQHQSDFQFVFQEVIVTGFFVEGDRAAIRFGFFLGTHDREYN